MKTKIKIVAIPVTLFVLTVLRLFAFGQMGGSRMGPGSGDGRYDRWAKLWSGIPWKSG